MGVLGTIVGVPTDLAARLIAQLAHRGRVGFQPVRDERLGPAVALQGLAQEP